jgi:hypothetical protein
MSTEREDALTLGARMREEEREASEMRVDRAILHGNGNSSAPAVQGRRYIASMLYQSRYDGRPYWEAPDHQEVLETFCWNVFGCNFSEVLKAWDKALG